MLKKTSIVAMACVLAGSMLFAGCGGGEKKAAAPVEKPKPEKKSVAAAVSPKPEPEKKPEKKAEVKKPVETKPEPKPVVAAEAKPYKPLLPDEAKDRLHYS